MVVDDAPLAEAAERQWKAGSKRPIEVAAVSLEQFQAEHLLQGKPLGVDAIIYPAGMIGELAERNLIVPMPKAALAGSLLAVDDLLPFAKMHETRWGEQTYAVSFGSPQFALMYRSDVFAKLQLTPPATWAEYAQLAEVLSDRAVLGELVAADAPWSATIEPLAAGWASQVLLARAAPYARRRNRYSTLWDYSTMEPMIDLPPFVRALEELAEAAKYGPADIAKISPHDARRALLAGRCAMALTWPTNATALDDEETTTAGVPLACAELPGSGEVFDFHGSWQQRSSDEDERVPLLSIAGRLGSIAKDSPQPNSAADLLGWLAGEQWSSQISPHSRATTPFRNQHLKQPVKWVDAGFDQAAARSYADFVRQTNERTTPLVSLRIPGRARYLSALDAAVVAATSGTAEPAAALATAADQWRQISDEIGLDKQRSAYRRSLGLEP